MHSDSTAVFLIHSLDSLTRNLPLRRLVRLLVVHIKLSIIRGEYISERHTFCKFGQYFHSNPATVFGIVKSLERYSFDTRLLLHQIFIGCVCLEPSVVDVHSNTLYQGSIERRACWGTYYAPHKH
jgi:hypothetical protein